MSNRLFNFVRQFSNELFELALRIEDQLFEQPHATLIQTRLYAEELVKMISQKEGLENVYPLKPIERIHKLYRQDFINEDIYMKLEWIRKMGNKAAHNVKEIEMKDVLEAHKLLFEISVWYMQVYVSFDFQEPIYKLPIKNNQEASFIALEGLDALIKEEVQRQIKENGLENEKAQDPLMETIQDLKSTEKDLSKSSEKAIKPVRVPLSKQKESYCSVFEKNNYLVTYETVKAVEFEHTISKEVVYLVNNKETSIVLNPSYVEKNNSLKDKGKRRSSTALRQFPKEKNKGENPISFGYMYVFQTESELDLFLKSLNELSTLSK